MPEPSRRRSTRMMIMRRGYSPGIDLVRRAADGDDIEE
jgi:hypothetical protein